MDRSEIAQLFRRFADVLESSPPQLIPVPQTVPLASKPAKLRAPEGSFFTSGPDWRQFIIQLEGQLREYFGTQPIYMRRLREFLQDHVELLPGDLERCSGEGHKSPRWFGNLQSAIKCDPRCWPLGRAVIVPAGTRGYYRLT